MDSNFEFQMRIAVHCHLFYIDLMDEIIQYLNNIPMPFDLYVSTDSFDKKYKIEQAFVKCRCVNLHIKVFNNRGRDILPFLRQLGDVIDNYDVVLHIHTKKTVTADGYGDYWRKYLFRHLLGSEKYIVNLLYDMHKDKALGIAFPETYPAVKLQVEWGGNRDLAASLLQRLGIDNEIPLSAPVFPVGNMFWAKTAAIKQIFKQNLADTDFPSENGQVNATLAHAIERSWVYIVYANGYYYKKYFNSVINEGGRQKNNLVIFVHYDSQNIISTEDIMYIENLSSAADNVIFVSNSSLSKTETIKLKKIVSKVIVRQNSGYDFAMWREALFSDDYHKYDNIILANNSCLNVRNTFSSIIDEMNKRDVDFWGITKFPYLQNGSYIGADHIEEHLQSYFIAFSHKVINSDAFYSFWTNLQTSNTMKETIALCEQRLTKFLVDSGFKYSAYIEESDKLCQWLGNYSIPFSYPYQLLLLDSPLVKKKSVNYASPDELTSVGKFVEKLKRLSLD